MGIDIGTYRCRIGTFQHGPGLDVILLHVYINYTGCMKIVGAVSFIGLLLLMGGIEANPGPSAGNMETLKDRLNNTDYKTWLKGGLVLKHLKNGIADYLDSEVQSLHTSILNSIQTGLPAGAAVSCTTCNNASAKQRNWACRSRNICTDINTALVNQHKMKRLMLANTDVSLWTNLANYWEVGKCFISIGYKDKQTAREIDCTGLLCLIINCKQIQQNFSTTLTLPVDIFEQIRCIRNEKIMHNADLTLLQADLDDLVKCSLAVLTDPVLLTKAGSIHAVNKINEINTAQFTFTMEDEHQVLFDRVKALEVKQLELEMEVKQVKQNIADQQTTTKADIDTLQKDMASKMDLLQTEMNTVNETLTKINSCIDDDNDQTRKLKADMENVRKKNEDFLETIEGLRQRMEAALKKGLKAIQAEAEKATTGVQEAGRLQIEQIKDTLIIDYNTRKRALKKGSEAIHEAANKATIDVEAVGKDQVVQITEVGKDQVVQVSKVGRDQVVQVSKVGRDQVVQITEAGRHQLEQITESSIRDYSTDKHNLQAGLIQLYQASSLTIPLTTARPIVQTNIEKMYVEPSMQIIDPGKEKTPKLEENIKIEEIFVKGAHRYSNIYVGGEAGTGKTSFCKKIISLWCSTCSGNSQDDADQVQIMKDFEFLFYIPLRNVESEYHVEEMIKKTLLLNTDHQEVFTRILKKESERCLIILDGLDEWIPPSKYEKAYGVTEGLPGRNLMYKYTILTTSRPWKLEVLRLATSEMDQQIKLTGIDDEAAFEFIENVLNILNARGESSKIASDFVEELESNRLSHFKAIPVMLKQLILIWFSGKPLGTSQCDIYSGMIDLRLTQAEMRDKTLFENVCRKSDLQLPECFSGKSKCKECVPLLYSLAKLAFKTLISKNRETSLVFEQSVAESHGVDENDIQTCLEVGILSKDIVPDLYIEKTKLSFLHKSYQEYLTALYITMRAGDDKIIEHIFSFCNTVEMLLEMSKVVLFVSGMNPTIAEKLSPGIRNVMEQDGSIQQYRREAGGENGYIMNSNQAYIENIQDMIIDCMKESSDNGHGHLNLPLDDIYIDEDSEYSDKDLEALQHQVTQNTANIKSVTIYCQSEARYSDLLQHILHCESLEKIILGGDLTNMSLDNFTNMNLPKIVALGLHNCRLTHDQICRLTSLSQRTQLTQIVLDWVRCSDHGDQCRHQLDLSQNKQLQKLTLAWLYIDKVTLNPAEMTYCCISILPIPGAAASILRCLPGATKLQTLRCGGLPSSADIDTLETVLPTLVHLRRVVLVDIDLSDRNILLSPQMMNLEYVKLFSVTWTDAGVCEFVASIPDTPHPVTCELGLHRVKYTRVCDYIRSSPRYVVTHYIPGDYSTSINFHTQKPGEGTRPQK